MKILCSIEKNKGLTLTELIVSTVILGIVGISINSIDFALRRTHTALSQKASLTTENARILLHLMKNIQLATGDKSNPGLSNGQPFGTYSTAPYLLWVRAQNYVNPNPDPNSYTDDIWVR